MKSLSRRIGALAAAICILAGCASTHPAISSGSFVLAEKHQVALGRSVALHYDSFADSRCPKNVQCIWAGKRSYQFTLARPDGSETFKLAADGDAFASAALKGVSIVLSQTEVPAAASAEHAVALRVVVK
jgi:hypothetical protein